MRETDLRIKEVSWMEVVDRVGRNVRGIKRIPFSHKETRTTNLLASLDGSDLL